MVKERYKTILEESQSNVISKEYKNLRKIMNKGSITKISEKNIDELTEIVDSLSNKKEELHQIRIENRKKASAVKGGSIILEGSFKKDVDNLIELQKSNLKFLFPDNNFKRLKKQVNEFEKAFKEWGDRFGKS